MSSYPTSTLHVRAVSAAALALSWLLLGAGAHAQGTFYVDPAGGPGTYATIQSAIDASAPGDTILVAPGTYLERIAFAGGRAVLADGAGGAATHVLDAQGTGTAVSILEQTGGRLEGFTVTGGVGSIPSSSYDGAAGGIMARGDVVIRDCVIVANQGAAHTYPNITAGAGGMGSYYGGSFLIERCEFRDNVGGAATESGFLSWNNWGGVGGLAIHGIAGSSADGQIVDCLFDGNLGGPGSAGQSPFFPPGPATLSQPNHGPGAVWVVNAGVDMTGCTFSGNVGATSPGFTAAPGGVLAGFLNEEPYEGEAVTGIKDSLFVGNSVGAVRFGLESFSVALERCILVGNVGPTISGAWPSFAPALDCVLIGNSGGPALTEVPAVGCVVTQHDPTGAPLLTGEVAQSIVWDNAALVPPGSASITRSCVEGGYAGTGNLDADPLFVQAPSPGVDGTWGTADDDLGDLRLDSGSPCIDAGDNTLAILVSLFSGIPHLVDLAGNVRYADDPTTVDTGVGGGQGGSAILDMGPHEHGAPPSVEWTDLGGALGWHGTFACAGSLTDASPTWIAVDFAPASAPVYLVAGLSQIDAPFKQGVLVPSPDLVLPLGTTDVAGQLVVPLTWPVGLPSGLSFVLQEWIPSPSGPAGYLATYGLQGSTP
ncbi:MAG: hypothetical protein ACYTG2_18570 [Planctomycetota bacterium]